MNSRSRLTLSFDIGKCMRILFVIYLVCLVVLVAFKFRGSINLMLQMREDMELQRAMGESNFAFAPFKTISFALNYIDNRSYQLDLFWSIFCYLPLGIFIPVLLPSRYRLLTKIGLVFLSSFLIIISIEFIQYFTLFGVFNLDDIILGMIDALLGYIIYILGSAIAKAVFANKS